MREAGDDLFCHAIGKVVLVWIPAHIGERQDGNRGLVGKGWGLLGASTRRSFGLALLAHLADEPEALSKDCANQPLVFAIVLDRVAGRVDAARQRGIGYDSPVPNRRNEVVLSHHAIAVA